MRTFAHISRGMVCSIALLLTAVTLSVRSPAQSLNPQKPAPLQSGANTGTVDNFVGANYFYFWGGAGKVTVTITYKSMSLLGNAQKSALTIELSDDKKSWTPLRTTISSLKESNQRELSGDLKKETKLIIAVIPPSGGLVRAGGDYEIRVTGAVRFDKPLTDTELIVGTYTPMTVYDNEDTAAKFLPDGTFQFASGTKGTWKLFDSDTHLYTVTFGSNRLSLKLIPGRGLVSASDPTSIVFQRTK